MTPGEIYLAIGIVVSLVQIYFHITTSPEYDPNDNRNIVAFVIAMIVNPFIYPLTVMLDMAEAKQRKGQHDTNRF